jgi:hypothetical protein
MSMGKQNLLPLLPFCSSTNYLHLANSLVQQITWICDVASILLRVVDCEHPFTWKQMKQAHMSQYHSNGSVHHCVPGCRYVAIHVMCVFCDVGIIADNDTSCDAFINNNDSSIIDIIVAYYYEWNISCGRQQCTPIIVHQFSTTYPYCM